MPDVRIPGLADWLQAGVWTAHQRDLWEKLVREVLPALLLAGSGVTITQGDDGTLTFASTGGGSSGSTWLMDSAGAVADPGEISVDDLDSAQVTQIRIAGTANSGGDYSALWMALASPSHIEIRQGATNFGRYGVLTTGQTLDGDFQIDVDPSPVAANGTFVAGQEYTVTVDLIGASSTSETVAALSSASGVVNIDCDAGDYFQLVLTEDVTSITFTNLPGPGQAATKWIEIVQDSAVAYSVTFPAEFTFTDGSDTEVTSTLDGVSSLGITTLNEGVRWTATMQDDV